MNGHTSPSPRDPRHATGTAARLTHGARCSHCVVSYRTVLQLSYLRALQAARCAMCTSGGPLQHLSPLPYKLYGMCHVLRCTSLRLIRSAPRRRNQRTRDSASARSLPVQVQQFFPVDCRPRQTCPSLRRAKRQAQLGSGQLVCHRRSLLCSWSRETSLISLWVSSAAFASQAARTPNLSIRL